MTGLLSAAFLAVMPATVAAQFSPGDTVRYRETTEGSVMVETPGEMVTFETTHDARLAVHRVTPDSMEAWYEALEVRSRGPDGETTPATDGFMGEKFVLRYATGGRVETLATPDFPAELAGVTDLGLQFEDFFPDRPGIPLVVGASWPDTAVTVTREEGRENRLERVSSYRVVSDTVVDGEAHLVIHAAVRISMEGTGPMAEEPRVTVSTSLDGVEENVFVVRRSDGRMRSRTRTGELEGTMAYLGMRAPVEFPLRRSYVNRITTVR